MWRTLLLALLVFAFGCAEPRPLEVQGPTVHDEAGRELAGQVLQFGAVEVGAVARRVIVVKNGGAGPVSLEVGRPSLPFSIEPAPPASLEAGESWSGTIIFAPVSRGESLDLIHLRAGGEELSVGLSGTGVCESGVMQTDTFSIPVPSIDLLVVVDAGLMNAYRARLEEFAARLALFVPAQWPDFRIAVTTGGTGPACGGVPGVLLPTEGAPADRLLGPDSPDLDSKLTAALTAVPCDDATFDGLNAAEIALTSPLDQLGADAPGEFFRSTSLARRVLWITDDPGTVDTTIDSWVMRMAARLNLPEASFGRQVIVPLSDDCAGGPADGYAQLASAGRAIDLCSSWDPVFEWGGDDAGPVSHLRLSRPPLDVNEDGFVDERDGARVEVNGRPIPSGRNGWSIDPEESWLNYPSRSGDRIDAIYPVDSCP